MQSLLKDHKLRFIFFFLCVQEGGGRAEGLVCRASGVVAVVRTCCQAATGWTLRTHGRLGVTPGGPPRVTNERDGRVLPGELGPRGSHWRKPCLPQWPWERPSQVQQNLPEGSDGQARRPRSSTARPARLPARRRQEQVCKCRPEDVGLLRTATGPTAGHRWGLCWLDSVSSHLLFLCFPVQGKELRRGVESARAGGPRRSEVLGNGGGQYAACSAP